MSQSMELESIGRDSHSIAMGRWVGILFGVMTQLLFLFTVPCLFLFLRFGADPVHANWVLVDSLLAVGFCLPHSILLAPPIQRRIKQWIPSGVMGCVHCSLTCISLLTMFHYWRGSETVIWQCTGWIKTVMLTGFYGSWLALFYSLYLTGMGYQTGLTPWWYWMTRQKPPVRQMVTRGAFRYMRHPVYMSFLGLIWFTPTMTADHAVLTAVWTVYIYAGSYFKDRRLTKFIGKPYQEYGRMVTGLPIIGFGSLRKFS
jgi:methanethiol S-methyltransferase